MRNRPLNGLGLAGVNVGGGESRGSGVLGCEAAFRGDDKGLGVLLIADLADEGGVVGEHEICVHDLGVGWLEGQRGGQLVGVDVAIGGSLTSHKRRGGDL